MSWQDKYVYVYKAEHDVCQDVREFQKIIQDAVDKIPQEYLSTAHISITTHSCGCYNDYESCIEIYYICPKTKEELEKEERQFKAREKARIFELEKELAELKKRNECRKTI